MLLFLGGGGGEEMKILLHKQRVTDAISFLIKVAGPIYVMTRNLVVIALMLFVVVVVECI